jgi:hypothetical protein
MNLRIPQKAANFLASSEIRVLPPFCLFNGPLTSNGSLFVNVGHAKTRKEVVTAYFNVLAYFICYLK